MTNQEQQPRIQLLAEPFMALMLSKKTRGCDLKVALMLLLLSRQHPDLEAIPISQRKLAELTGYDVRQVSEALARLAAEGMVTVPQGYTALGRTNAYTFNINFEQWGVFKVDRLQVLGSLKNAPARPPAEGPAETTPGVSAVPERVSALPDPYINILLEDGLKEEETGQLPKPTAQTILGYAVGFCPKGVYLPDGFKRALGWQIKQLLLANENPEFIKEAARRLVVNSQPKHIVPAQSLPAFLNDVKRERKHWPDFGFVTWDGKPAPGTTLEELMPKQEKLEEDSQQGSSSQEDMPDVDSLIEGLRKDLEDRW